MELLLKLLPRYSAHIAQYPDTLLIKYLGLHRIKPANGGKVRVLQQIRASLSFTGYTQLHTRCGPFVHTAHQRWHDTHIEYVGIWTCMVSPIAS